MLFMTSCWSATLAANHVTGDWHTESLFKQEYAREFQVHVLDKEIHCQTNELHVICEVGMCKYSIQSTLISIIDWPWPRYPWQHSAFQLPVRSIQKKWAFCRLTCDYLTKPVCQSGVIECFWTVYVFCIWINKTIMYIIMKIWHFK